jgi:hypothetical protein
MRSHADRGNEMLKPAAEVEAARVLAFGYGLNESDG